MNSYRLLVFDWDGTLMDSEARIVACMRSAAAAVGAAPPSTEAARRIIGLGMREAILALYPAADDDFIERFVRAYRDRFLGADATPQVLFEGVPDMLAALEEAGYLLAVATGKSRAGLDRVLRQTGLTGRFHATRCADEAFSKPHPAMLEDVMERVGAAPPETLMIGDTTFDLEMAHNAGVEAVGVSHGAHEVAALLQWRPRTILDRIDALPAWLRDQDEVPTAV
ncbi:HAD family hydrolase [Acidihalobacter ferrooxydans]|uniref:HAD family hydrolase n=1 Tax=Acidihalobacter ferrooxydans TaxID=1765967 RepID=A0A1P8UFN3_9GAMM|nr:HAD-IIIA family hydrolase [Acidihalobacter ferrooxydans]APZ42662.1 HAD family hydrolase [Acidihalobacter ferrooxydans]